MLVSLRMITIHVAWLQHSCLQISSNKFVAIFQIKFYKHVCGHLRTLFLLIWFYMLIYRREMRLSWLKMLTYFDFKLACFMFDLLGFTLAVQLSSNLNKVLYIQIYIKDWATNTIRQFLNSKF